MTLRWPGASATWRTSELSTESCSTSFRATRQTGGDPKEIRETASCSFARSWVKSRSTRQVVVAIEERSPGCKAARCRAAASRTRVRSAESRIPTSSNRSAT